jgi:hypothetical protein
MTIEFLFAALITFTLCAVFILLVGALNHYATLTEKFGAEIKRLMAVYHHAYTDTNSKTQQAILEKAWREMPETIKKEIQ